MSDRDAFLSRAGPVREVALDGCIQVDALLPDELGGRTRCGDRLGQRDQIPEGRVTGTWCVARPVDSPRARAGEDTTGVTDDGVRTGERAVTYGRREDARHRVADGPSELRSRRPM